MNFKNLVWAIDHQSASSKVNSAVARFLKVFAKGKNTRIHPTTVLALGKLGFLQDLPRKEVSNFKEEAISETSKILKDNGLGDLVAELEVSKGRSTADAIKALNKHVKKVKGDLIVIGSHNRKAVERFFLGSFAENLIFSSKIPTLIINPEMTPQKESLERILVTIDFGENYLDEVKEVWKFAKAYNIKEVDFFHYFGLGRGTARQPEFIRENLEVKTSSLEKLVVDTKKKGFQSKYHIQLEEKNIKDSILDSAHKSKAQLIMMKGKTEKAQAMFVGSVTRNVVRYSKVPVLIFH